MDPGFWDRISNLYEAARTAKPAERQRLLAEAPEDIRLEAAKLLEFGDQAGDFLNEPLMAGDDLVELGMSEPRVLQEGELLAGRFRVVRFLGRGGMGEVYECHEEGGAGGLVAIKTVRYALLVDPSIGDRFRKEVQHARRVTHTNVCRIHDMFTAMTQSGVEAPFLTMELLDGVTLRDYIRDHGPLSVSEARAIADQICEGLAAAHRAGVIHRDLKSLNIMITSSGRAVITDFGLATIAMTSSEGSDSSSGRLTGTIAYMAPELVEGGPAGVASDIYALGVVLFEMVTGKFPFQAESELVSAAMRLRHRAPSPRDSVRDLPRNWDRAICYCLASSPAERIASADSVRAMLRGKLLEELSIAAPLAGRRWLSRRRVLIAAGIAGAAVGVHFLSRSSGGERSIMIGRFTADESERFIAAAAQRMMRVALRASPDFNVIRESELELAAGRLGLERQAWDAANTLRIAREVGAGIIIGGQLKDSQLSVSVMDASTAHPAPVGVEEIRDRKFATGLDKLVLKLRQSLGESDVSIQSHTHPIEQPDTLVPEAMETFAKALDLFHGSDSEPALNLLEYAVQLDPQFAMAFVYQAHIHAALRREHRGFAAAKRAYELRDRVNHRQRLQSEAIYHTLTGDFVRAAAARRVLAETYSGSADLQRHLAHAYSTIDRLDDAIKFARTATAMAPENANNHLVLASVLSHANKPEDALRSIATARRSLGDRPVLDLSEGFAFMVQGRVAQALKAYERAERAADLRPNIRGNRERCLILSGRLQEARAELESQLLVDESDKDYAWADLRHYWLGQILLAYGDTAAASKHARHLASREAIPPFALSLRNAAEIAHSANDAESLSMSARKLRRIEHEYPNQRIAGFASQAKGLASALAGRTDAARREFDGAYNLWPDVSSGWMLGSFLVRTGEYERANQILEKLVKAKGTALRWEGVTLWVRSLALSAECELGRNNLPIALSKFERFLSHWGNNPELPEVRLARARCPKCSGNNDGGLT